MINQDNINRPRVLAEVTAAFYRYEEALVSNNIAVLDELFWHDKRTVRLGAGENLYGIDEIRAFRAARPAAGLQRELRHTEIVTFGEDYAVCSTEFTRAGSDRIGRQQPLDIGLRVIWGIPNAEMHIFNQCGHWAQWEHAETFNQMVKDFLARA